MFFAGGNSTLYDPQFDQPFMTQNMRTSIASLRTGVNVVWLQRHLRILALPYPCKCNCCRVSLLRPMFQARVVWVWLYRCRRELVCDHDQSVGRGCHLSPGEQHLAHAAQQPVRQDRYRCWRSVRFACTYRVLRTCAMVILLR